MKKFSQISEENNGLVVDYILKHKPQILLLTCEVGAGKTTLIKKLVAKMGALTPATSPTYGLLNEYETPNGIIYHSDWYRIQDPEELYDAGIMEYFNLPAMFIIEWPEIGLAHIPKPYIKLEISHGNGHRDYSFSEIS